jgi:hypothetical protein
LPNKRHFQHFKTMNEDIPVIDHQFPRTLRRAVLASR